MDIEERYFVNKNVPLVKEKRKKICRRRVQLALTVNDMSEMADQ